jgi:hypothetical protein
MVLKWENNIVYMAHKLKKEWVVIQWKHESKDGGNKAQLSMNASRIMQNDMRQTPCKKMRKQSWWQSNAFEDSQKALG